MTGYVNPVMEHVVLACVTQVFSHQSSDLSFDLLFMLQSDDFDSVRFCQNFVMIEGELQFTSMFQSLF